MSEVHVVAEGGLAPPVAGYLHPGYAGSLSEFGAPIELPGSGGWVLRRPIPGSPFHDATGCYPLFACQDWSRLSADLALLAPRHVTLSLVTDPFGDHDVATLRRSFDVVTEFKSHFVADLRQRPSNFVFRSHRRNIREALRHVEVERCEDPSLFVDEWTRLYASLAERRGLVGLRAFSRAAFARQLAVPGLVMFRACAGGATVGLHLWFLQGSVAYAHLGATTWKNASAQSPTSERSGGGCGLRAGAKRDWCFRPAIGTKSGSRSTRPTVECRSTFN